MALPAADQHGVLMTDHKRAQLARKGLYEHASMCQAAGQSADEWHCHVQAVRPDALELVGARTVDAIVAVVWLSGRRRW